MFATLDHRDIARRAAPKTSLPGLILDPGALSEEESPIVIFLLGHLICRLLEGSTSCTVYDQTEIVEPSISDNRTIMAAKRRIGAGRSN